MKTFKEVRVICKKYTIDKIIIEANREAEKGWNLIGFTKQMNYGDCVSFSLVLTKDI